MTFNVLMTYLSLVCPAPIVKNTSNHPWNKHDDKVLKSAKVRCDKHYRGYPCVISFHKTEALNYRVICGKMR